MKCMKNVPLFHESMLIYMQAINLIRLTTAMKGCKVMFGYKANSTYNIKMGGSGVIPRNLQKVFYVGAIVTIEID